MDTKTFYKSMVWRRCREKVLARDLYLCQECLKTRGPVPADTVHHIVHLKDDPSKALDEDNLVSVCAICHNRLHPEKRSQTIRRIKQKRINYVEMEGNPDIF